MAGREFESWPQSFLKLGPKFDLSNTFSIIRFLRKQLFVREAFLRKVHQVQFGGESWSFEAGGAHCRAVRPHLGFL